MMNLKIISLLCLFAFSSLAFATLKEVISTCVGEMTFELDDKTAPKTTTPFIRLAKVAGMKAKAIIG